MRKFADAFLAVVTVISLFSGLICTVFIFYCEFFGYDKGNDFLTRIQFPLNDNGIIVLCFVSVLFLFLSIFLRKRFLSAKR